MTVGPSAAAAAYQAIAKMGAESAATGAVGRRRRRRFLAISCRRR